MSDFDRSLFWPELKSAGMLRSALVKQSGRLPVTVDVKYEQPTNAIFGQAASQDHQIEYQAADLPALTEGDPVSFLDDAGVVIRAERFKVREAPFVSSDPATDRTGFFKLALLTRIA